MNLSTIEITGTINYQPKVKISGNIDFTKKLNITGTIQLAGGGRTYPIYEGEYIVTPRVYEQKLLTDEKLMEDDVTVLVIPKAEVLNIQNGLTVTIG